MPALHAAHAGPTPGRAVTILALAGLAVWTLLGLGAWAVIGIGGDVLYALIGKLFWSDPEMGRLVGGVGRILEGLGAGLVILVWAVGAGLIWAGWAALRRLALTHVVLAEARFHAEDGFSRDEPPPWGRRPMKDVTPPANPTVIPPTRGLPPR